MTNGSADLRPTTGVSWYGYDKAVEIQDEEKDNALLLWNAVMNKIHEGMPYTVL